MEAWQFGPGPARPARLLVDASHVGPALSTAPGRRRRGGAGRRLGRARAAGDRRRRLPVVRRSASSSTPRCSTHPISAPAVVDWLSRHRRRRGAAVRLSTAEKLQRLISIVAWINGREDGATLDEVCARFDISRGELVAQLEMANMIGAESEDYTDMPVDVTFEGDVVRVFLMEFHRPLAAHARAGPGPRRRRGRFRGPARRRPGRAAAPGAGQAGGASSASTRARRSTSTSATPTRPSSTSSAGRSSATMQVEVDYWSAGRDDQTHRVVDPWRVFSDEGAWYVQGHCHRAGGERVFRVDRIQALTVLDETFERPGRLPDAVAYRAGAEDPRVVLELDPEVRLGGDDVPGGRVEELGDGRLRVTMPAGAPAFLARLLLRLGPDAARRRGRRAIGRADRRRPTRPGACSPATAPRGAVGGRGDRR